MGKAESKTLTQFKKGEIVFKSECLSCTFLDGDAQCARATVLCEQQEWVPMLMARQPGLTADSDPDRSRRQRAGEERHLQTICEYNCLHAVWVHKQLHNSRRLHVANALKRLPRGITLPF